MAIKATLSCLSTFGLAVTLSGCAGAPDKCATTQTPHFGSVQPASQAIQDAVKSGTFKSGPGITSSMTAPVGITVTRKTSVGCN